MSFLPVVQRELSELSRRPTLYWARAAVALLALLAMSWIALVAAGNAPANQQGLLLFNTISQGAFLFALVAGVRLTADALSEEKREGTLGLLFLTDLKGYDVALGKLVSRSATAAYCVLALAPTLAVSILLGGADLNMLALRCVSLLNTLFLSLTVGVLVSTFSHHERAAMGATLGVIFAVAAGPYIVAGYHAYTLDLRDAMLPGFLIYSPVYAFIVSSERPFGRMFIEEFWQSIAFTHLLGWLAIVVAGACLPARAHAERPRSRIAAWIHDQRQRISYGRAAQRITARRALLDQNAFSWLASRDRLKRRYPWIFLALFGALWGWFYYKAPEVIFDLPVLLTVIWFLHIFIKVWAASEIASRFIEDRRSNALELLLTTPLGEREIARGQGLALLRQFGGPLLVLVLINAVAGYATRNTFGYGLSTENNLAMFAAGVVVLLADLYAIRWVAMWRSLRLKGTNRTILQTTAIVIVAPILLFWILFQASWVFAIALRIPPISWSNAAWPWAIFCVIYDAALVAIARRGFYKSFRESATQAFDSRKPAEEKPEKVLVPKAPTVPFFRQLRVRIALGLLIFLGALLVAASIRREFVQSKVEDRMALVRSRGEPITRAELAAWQRNPLPAESAYTLLSAAQRQLVKGALWTAAHEAERQPGNASNDAALRQVVATNRAFYATLAELLNRKPGIPMNESAFMMRLASISDITQALRFKAALAEREGASEDLASAITAMLYLARTLEGQIVLLNIRSQTLDAAFPLIAAAARDNAIGPEDWRLWCDVLGQMDSRAEFRRQLAAVRVEGVEVFGMSPDGLWQRFGRAMSPFPSLFAATMGVRRLAGQHDSEILEFLESVDRLQERMVDAYRDARAALPRRSGMPGLTSSEVLLPHITQSFEWMLSAAYTAQARALVLQMVCELEMLRRRGGRLPESGAAMFVDPFDLQPLRYRRLENGYVVYSVGENLQDDSRGQPSRNKKLDIAITVEHGPAQ